MNINNVLHILTYTCLYYYKTYNKRIYDDDIELSSNIFEEMKLSIYNNYRSAIREVNDLLGEEFRDFKFDEEEITDMRIGPEYLHGKYILEEHIPSFDEIESIINKLFDLYDDYGIITHPINILYLGYHPIENAIIVNSKWVKRTVDLFRY